MKAGDPMRCQKEADVNDMTTEDNSEAMVKEANEAAK